MPEPEPVPTVAETQEPVSKAIREEERRRIKGRRAMSGTLLTSPLGTTGSGSGNGLLGRI